MSSPSATPLHALPIALVAACLVVMGCSASPPMAVSGAPANAGDLSGQVTLPVDVVGEAAVIPTGVGRVIPTGMGRYRVRSLGEELPVTGALVMAFDAVTHQALPNVGPVTTDERGGFTLHGVPAGPVVIEAIATVGPDEYHLLAFTRPSTEPLAVSWRSTAVVEPLLERTDTSWSSLDADALHRQEATVATQAEALTPDARRSLITDALKHPLPLPFGPLLPSSAPSASPTAGTGTVGAIASAVPAVVTSAVPAVVTSAVPQLLASTVPSVLQSTLPSAVSQIVSTTPTAVASTVPQTLTSTVPAIIATTVPLVGGVTQTVGQATTTVTQPLTQVLAPLTPSPKPSSLLPIKL
jgi:hypothetical protein